MCNSPSKGRSLQQMIARFPLLSMVERKLLGDPIGWAFMEQLLCIQAYLCLIG